MQRKGFQGPSQRRPGPGHSVISLKPSGVTAWTEEACRRVVRDAAAEGHPVSHVWGYSASSSSDHRNRRCIDFMVLTRADGDWLLGYLRRHRVALRVRYIIWWGMQWRDYRKPGVRLRSLVRYYGWNQHRDHLHVEFDE